MCVCVDVLGITYCHGGTQDLTSCLWVDIIIIKGSKCLEIRWHKREIGYIGKIIRKYIVMHKKCLISPLLGIQS